MIMHPDVMRPVRDAAAPTAAPDSGTEAERDGKTPPAPAPTSVVQRLFGGKLASTVVCGGCGHTSTAVEPFMCVVSAKHLNC